MESDEFLEQQAEAIERQTAALEAIATEMRYQNAVLCEMVACLDDLSARADEHHMPDHEPRDRSGRAIQTAIRDHLFERDDTAESGMGVGPKGRPTNWGGDRDA